MNLLLHTHTKALSKDHANVIFSNYSGKKLRFELYLVQYLNEKNIST